ncbi:MAG TPA: hypothetical protein ENI31_05895, partial [Candidatus Omnitrophica bacterium]|nr:hypothetical protein [Candidatus Omnitrophota bacterium]
MSHIYELTLINGEFDEERRIDVWSEWWRSIKENRLFLLTPIFAIVTFVFIGWLLGIWRLWKVVRSLRRGSTNPNDNTPRRLLDESQIPRPTYGDYGFDDQVKKAAQYRFSVVIERLRRGDSVEEIANEYFQSYKVWRNIMKSKGPFNPTIEDLWIFFLIKVACGYFRTDTPSFFNYLLHKALQMKDNRVGDFIREQYEIWFTILNLTMATFKGGVPPFTKYAQLIPDDYIFNTDDLEEMFRTKRFVDFYDSLMNRKQIYEILINKLLVRVKNLKEAIDRLVDTYGGENKLRIKRKLIKMQEYKDFINFIKKEWRKENPLFYKTYPDLVGIRALGIKGGLHALRNFYVPIAFFVQLTVVGLALALLMKGILFNFFTLVTLVAFEFVLWYGGRKGLNLYLSYSFKRRVRIKKDMMPTRPDEGYSKVPVPLKLKIFRFLFWMTFAAIKIIWNAHLFNYFLIAYRELKGAVWLSTLGLNFNFLLIVALWFPFILFFFLDCFSIYYLLKAIVGYLYGKYLGLGIIKRGRYWDLGSIKGKRFPWYRKIDKESKFMIDLIKDKFIPKELNLNEDQKVVVVAEIINMILSTLLEEDMIDKSEFEANRWMVARREGDNFLEGKVRIPESFFDFDNKKIRDRISVFLNSLLMDIPELPVWEKIKPITVLVPVAQREAIVYSYEELDRLLNTGVTRLTYLITRYPDEWHKFIERMRREDKVNVEELERMQSLKLGDSLGKVNEELEWEIRLWASYRFQPFVRTLRGWMHYVEVLRLYARITHPEWGKKQIDDEVNKKFQFLWIINYAGLAKNNPAKAKDIERLVKYYYDKYHYLIDITYYNREGSFWYNFVVRLAPSVGQIRNIYKIKLMKEHPLLGQGKPGQQAYALGFVRGEIIFTTDVNQDFYIEQTLKIPHFLTLFDKRKNTAIIGFPEDIFTDTYSLIGKFAAF